MEQDEIKILLEKYWQAETTLEEEQRLADYFRKAETGPDLEVMRALFGWREEEAQLKPGEDFDNRMLRRISAEGSAAPGVIELGKAVSGEVEPGNAGSGKLIFSFRFAAAAAIILCIGISFLVVVTSPPAGSPPVVATVTPPRADTTIKDTYSDPRLALAAVRRALLTASVRINEGQRITQKNITRLHNSWQAATGD
jgi:hypothetical protein